MSLNNAMKIYSNTNKGGIFFEPSTVTPKLIGTCTAEIKSNRPDRVVIRRTDQVVQSTGEFRPIFGSFNPYRVQNEDGVDLIETLGYTIQQVVDYLNDEFNDFSTNSLELGEAINFFRDATNTSIFNTQGDIFAVNAVRAVNDNGSIRIQNYDGTIVYYNNILFELVTINDEDAGDDVDTVVNELNALFTVNAIGGGTETNYITIILDSGTASDLVLGTNVTESNDIITYNGGDSANSYTITYPSSSISENGEFIRFSLTPSASISPTGTSYIGMVDVSSSAYTDFLTNGIDAIKGGGTFKFGFEWDNLSFFNLSNENDGVGEIFQIADLNNTTWENSDEYSNFVSGSAQVIMRIGINSNGYGILSFFDSSENEYVDIARTQQLVGDGDYAFIYNPTSVLSPGLFGTGAAVSPEIFEIDPTNIIQSYYYIESPDNVYHYPLFATTTEANAYDTLQGGSGTSNTQLFTDDSVSGRQWHSPTTGYSSSANAAPTTPGITWNEINTQADNLFIPSAFGDTTFVFDEGDSFNIQVVPQDATSFTTTVTPTNGATFGSLGGNNFQGTCPPVLGDNVANPEDDYTFDVIRSNNFGSSTGILTLRVLNQTSPSGSITGFTHLTASTALPGSNLLGDGSVVLSDENVAEAQRYIIEQAYIETNILPNLTQAGDKYLIGNLNPGADVSTLELSDFDFCIAWEYIDNSSHKIQYYRDGVSQYSYNINSKTDAFYDYGIEIQTPDVYVFGCNVGDINNTPSPKYGGMLSNTFHFTASDNTAPLEIAFGNLGTTSSYDVAGLSEIITPAPERWIQVSKSGADYYFNDTGSLPSLQAGFTYRLLMGNVEYLDLTDSTGLGATDIFRFTENGISEYDMTNVTRSGAVGSANAFYEFTVPQAVPPIWWYTDADGINQNNGVVTAGSTYTASVTGITLEGPAANQTGTNIADNGEYGWMSIDESLSAGERFVMNNAFFEDLLGEMGDQYEIRIGLKGNNWANTAQSTNSNTVVTGDIFRGDIQLRIYRSSSNNIYLQLFRVGQTGNSSLANTVQLHNDTCGFIEVDSTGDIIQMGFGRNGNLGVTQGMESTTTYANWPSYKMQAYSPGFNITSLDVMFLVTDLANVQGDDYDGANVDWTHLSEIPIPGTSVANLTTWTKAVDFNGGSEHTKQGTVSNDWNSTQPLTMGGLATTVPAPSTSGNTTTSTLGRPWATAIVFQSKNVTSNQHIWNNGEGAGSTDDNIYLRVEGINGDLYFGWGRQGAVNECLIGNIGGSANSTHYWGIYIAHNGTRLSANDATPANLAAAFDIRLMGSNDTTPWGAVYDVGTVARWSSSSSTTGGRMDRSYTGDFTIGGRGNNRSFNGKVASMVVTTLKNNVAMPTDAEVRLMITDPIKWVSDYKLNGSYRYPTGNTNFSNFQRNGQNAANSTQVWLMGNTVSDSYPTLRNNIYTADTTKTSMIMANMVSNDIQTVTITDLP